MAAINQIKLNSTSTTYDVNDKRITTTAVTTATHFLATDSSVSSIAPITAANAASVLGALVPKDTAITDYNSATEPGIYDVTAETTTNGPSGIGRYVQLLVIRNQIYYTIQIATDSTKDPTVSYMRFINPQFHLYRGWSRIDNFGCSTLAELKAALDAL